jgi:aminopeptidase N
MGGYGWHGHGLSKAGVCGCRQTETTDLVVFDLSDTPLPGGTNVTLHATYNAHFSPNIGLYRSAPFTYYGQYSSVLVVTQLEQSGARHMFPSYDQPSHKVILL